MRSRRVSVLKLGSKGPGGDARSLRLWTQASASVRKRPQSFAIVRGGSDRPEGRRSSRNAELSSLFYVSYYKSVNGHRDRGGSWVVVAKRRTVVTFGLVLRLCVLKVSAVTGIGGGPGRETQNCRHFWTRLASSRLKRANSHRDQGGSWSRNAEFSSLFDSSCVFLRLKNVSSHRDRGGRGRKTQVCRHF